MIDSETLLQYEGITKSVAQNEVIIREEDKGWYYYQLITGSARAINLNESGREYLQYIVEPGDCFGVIPLFDDGKYAVTVVATKPSTIIRLPKERFLELLAKQPELKEKFIQLMCERLRFKIFLSKESANKDPQRSISNLIDYFKGTNKICGECNKLNLTRQQIADMLGLRVETVIRSIRNLHLNGKLEIKKGKVYCFD